MKITIFASLTFLLFGVATVSVAQTDPVLQRIVEIGQTDNRSTQHLDILCNRFGGRLIGSDAYENAAFWAASKFEEWGMEVVFDKVGELPVGFNRGPWFGRLLSDEGMILHFATPSYTSGTRGVQRGHVWIEPKNQAEFDRMKGALKGAWVLIGGENDGWPLDISAEERRYFQLEFDIRNHFKMGPVPYHNVIGVTPSMEAARLIMEAGGKPKRTILVTLWAGEEFGLYGSRSWVARYEDELDKVSNMVNRDGGPTVPVSLTVSAAQMEDFREIVEVINTINPEFPLELKERKPRPKPERAWGTDSGPFAVKGVPTIGFDLGDPKGYNFSYGEIWHTERDLYNKSIPEYQEQTATATAVLVYGLAQLDHLLSREGYYVEKDETQEEESQVRRRSRRK